MFWDYCGEVLSGCADMMGEDTAEHGLKMLFRKPRFVGYDKALICIRR